MINHWFKSHLPWPLRELSTWTSFALNLDLTAMWHSDRNAGASLITHIGCFNGGRLIVNQDKQLWGAGYRNPLLEVNCATVDCLGQVVILPPMVPHRSEPLGVSSDTRKLAFIFYNHKLSTSSLYDPTGHVHLNDCTQLQALGFSMDTFKGRQVGRMDKVSELCGPNSWAAFPLLNDDAAVVFSA